MKKKIPEKEFSCVCGNQIIIVFVGVKPFKKVTCDKCGREMRVPN